MENATPVLNDTTLTREPSAGTTAATMATWLSRRPFLTQTFVVRTTVGGRVAWLVSGVVRVRAPLHGEKNGAPAGPTFSSGVAVASCTHHLTGQYTLVDVPGAGVTVIWSWTLGSPSLLAGNQAYVARLSFG
jgi:hypothetical protein